ncbi:MAG TPA: hypothetical protein PLK94_13030, partial [Alphaproteobacteria bacterium]|nr:hypothetical protein [Alphaproteobacteria bacterium]
MVGLSNVMDFVRAKTQGDLMLAAGSTPEKVKVAEKMGLLKPSQPLVSEISKTKLLFDTKDYVE